MVCNLFAPPLCNHSRSSSRIFRSPTTIIMSICLSSSLTEHIAAHSPPPSALLFSVGPSISIRSSLFRRTSHRHPHRPAAVGPNSSLLLFVFFSLQPSDQPPPAAPPFRRSAVLPQPPTLLENLDVMLNHGPNAWKLYNQRLEAFLARMQSQAVKLNEEIESVNRERKYHQQNTAYELNSLSTQWSELCL
ncbi:uncharacterized protein LOC115995961 [Ipomoea triloba]|uniref:uncharacterized protein LOC115995961 n=1 Tax=Ipomoea triloba TaxID=35885 RepID=UPI00125E106A|nr:uncharacterized protein LOC115995961 [Ipomoea triloba]